ncbi:MAG: phosphate transport system permease protein [Pseudohongiellaceae bacterium]
MSSPRVTADQLAKRASRHIKEALIRLSLQACSLVSVVVSVGIVTVLLTEALPFFSEVELTEFLTGEHWTPLLEPRHFGVLPLVGGTLLVALIAAMLAIPVGSFAAIYLAEYASPRLRRWLKPTLEILAGVPTVVYGTFALAVVTPALQALLPDVRVFNALSAGLVVGIMILPMVASLSDDALRAVPRSLRDAGYAVGATRQEVSVGIVYPAAFSGVLSSYLLAISRAIGETMIVAMAAGSTPRLTLNPLDSIQTMTGYIVQVSLGDTPAGSLEYQSIFAVGLALFLMTLVMNLLSRRIKNRFRESYS